MNDFVKSKYMDFVLFAGYKNDYVHKKYISQGGTFDEAISNWILNNVKKDWIVYDIGANMFEFTEISARLVGNNGIVRSFEPQIDLVNKYRLAQLRNNYNSCGTIYIYPFGLGKNNSIGSLMINSQNLGAATFNKKFQEFSNSLYPSEWKSESFEIKRFDSLGINDEIPDLIKIDIEGGEEDVWAGATDTFKKAKNIIIEMGAYTSTKFFNSISKDRHIYNIKTMKPTTFQQIVLDKQCDVLLISKDAS